MFFSLLWKRRVALLEPSAGGQETFPAFRGVVPRGSNKYEIKTSDTGNSLIHEQLQIYSFANVSLKLGIKHYKQIVYMVTCCIKVIQCYRKLKKESLSNQSITSMM